MNNINNKINQFHTQLRKDQLNSIMKKARYEALFTADQNLIREIIDINTNQLTNQHLVSLIALANKDHSNAILHLGNLVIDRIVDKDYLEGVQWEIGVNQKWSWLINVFSEVQFCTEQMFTYIIRKIITKRSNFNLQNALQVIQRSLKLNKQSVISIIKVYPQLIIALCNHAFDAYDKVSQLAFILFTIITSFSNEEPIVIQSVLGDARIQKMILHGFNKLQNNIRILSCQIANNFLLSKIFLENAALRVLELALNQKESVKLQISYYFRAFSESIPQQTLLTFIRQHNLLGILRQYSKLNSKGKLNTQIKLNSIKTLSIVPKRFQDDTQYLILKQMDRLGLTQHLSTIIDESQEITYFHQEINNGFNVHNESSLMKE